MSTQTGGRASASRGTAVDSAERVYRTIDKSGWGPGEWQDEPDKLQWTDPATGLACLAKRTAHSGHWCGYVGVPPGHRFYKKSYDDVHDALGYGDDGLDVHGGLTYSAACDEGPESESICHVPAPGEPDNVWWLGFDCAHSGDLSPAQMVREELRGWPRLGGSYKQLPYVRSEVTSLAAQLAKAAS